MRRFALLPISLLILAGCDGSGSSSSPQAAATCPETGPHACQAGDTEPLYTFQWALNHVASFFSGTPDVSDGGLDLNVEPVHRQGIKGQGVNVLVLDSGVDFRNEDLAPNADPSLSRNLITQTSDPFPSETELKNTDSAHGTAVSGIVVAAQNGKGGMGIAPRASLGAANLLDAGLAADPGTLFEVYGGGDWSSKAHVINASYGKAFNVQPYEQGTSIDTAAVRSLKSLRAQKGIIFVKSAGNYFDYGCELGGGADEIAQLGELPGYTIDGTELRVLPDVPEGGQGTFLLNAQGAVGISRHEVMVADADEADLDVQLRMVQPQPVSVRRFTPTGITLVKFADFQQSVQGYEALSQALPQATVRLSVVFGRKTPRQA